MTRASNTPPSQPTKTTSPTFTITPTLVPGSLRPPELQKIVDSWTRGDDFFPEEERLLDERTVEPLRLGILGAWDTLLFFNLGYTTIDGPYGETYIINMAGFEDGQGARFAFPFHNSTLSESCNFIWLEIYRGRRINYGERISGMDELTPLEFISRSNELINRMTIANSEAKGKGSPRNDCHRTEDRYYDLGGGTFSGLVTFLKCESCSIHDAPIDLLKLINKVPMVYSEEIPFVRIYKTVNDD